MAIIHLDGQNFSLPDEIAANDGNLIKALRAVAPQIGERPNISRETKGDGVHVTVVKQAGTKGTADLIVDQWLSLHQIEINGGTQARAGVNPATVTEYEAAIRENSGLPPLDVFYDGERYWLADGFHRLAAFRAYFAGRPQEAQVRVVIHPGDRRAAMLYAAGANARHGLPRTNADKRRAVELLLRDPDWVLWSDGRLAQTAHVSQPFVGEVRRDLEASGAIAAQAVRQVERGGQTYQVAPPAAPARPTPTAPPPEERAFDYTPAPVAPPPPTPVATPVPEPRPTAAAPPVAAPAAPLPAPEPLPVPIPLPIPTAPLGWEACNVQVTVQLLPAEEGTRQVLISAVNDDTHAMAFGREPLAAFEPWPAPVAQVLATLQEQHTGAAVGG